MAKVKKQSPNRKPVTTQWEGLDAVAPYADVVRVNTGERAVMITFGQLHPDLKQIQVVNRVVLPPKTAGELLVILAQQAVTYEERYGKITPTGFVLPAPKEA